MKSEGKYKFLFFLLLAFVLGFVAKSLWDSGDIIKPKTSLAGNESQVIQQNLKLAQRISEAFSYVAEKASPAVVYIETEKVVSVPPQFFPFDFFGDPFFSKSSLHLQSTGKEEQVRDS